jgi:hypothetical protein
MTTSSSAAAEQHPNLHQRTHAANGIAVGAINHPSGAEHHSSSSHPADVEAAITAEGGKEPDSKDAGESAVAEHQVEQYTDVTYGDIFKQFSILGWTAFGGPAAHIGLFQRVGPVLLLLQPLCSFVKHRQQKAVRG